MELLDRLDEFLREKYYNELLKASKEDKVLIIDFNKLDVFDPVVADQLLEDPEPVFSALQEAANKIVLGEKINVRVKNLPESRNIRIRNLRAKHIGKLWCIDATIKSASEVKPQVYEAVFECPECSTRLTVPQLTNVIQGPFV